VIHPRIARARVLALARQFPAVYIQGPRQSGKSTLARWAFPDHAYLDLEKPADHDRMLADPYFVLSQERALIVDEAQRVPSLFPVLRSFLDEHPRHRVVLLGSASPALLARISESLTGRVGFFELGGISLLEEDRDKLWFRGGFPRVHWSRPRATPNEWYASYLRTCLEQDIPQLGFRLASQRLHTLLTMLAHVQGGLCNLSELGGSLGINYHAVAHTLDVLEGVFLLRRLQPYHANIGKRLVKSPKVYVRDTGILHHLLGVPHQRKNVLAHPKAGASFETFCIEQIATHARLVDPGAQLFFWRTHAGVEVDLLLHVRGRLVPIEIKLGLAVPELQGLQSCMADLELDRGFVVNRSTAAVEVRRGIVMCGVEELLQQLRLLPRASLTGKVPRTGRQGA
jgi:predicted AAA+ superfamily ATPase